jgi:hypothetical protein
LQVLPKTETAWPEKLEKLLDGEETDGTVEYAKLIVGAEIEEVERKKDEEDEIARELKLEEAYRHDLERQKTMLLQSMQNIEEHKKKVLKKLRDELDVCGGKGYIDLLESELKELKIPVARAQTNITRMKNIFSFASIEVNQFFIHTYPMEPGDFVLPNAAGSSDNSAVRLSTQKLLRENRVLFGERSREFPRQLSMCATFSNQTTIANNDLRLSVSRSRNHCKLFAPPDCPLWRIVCPTNIHILGTRFSTFPSSGQSVPAPGRSIASFSFTRSLAFIDHFGPPTSLLQLYLAGPAPGVSCLPCSFTSHSLTAHFTASLPSGSGT